MHTTAGPGGSTKEGKEGLWVPRKQTAEPRADAHAKELSQEDRDRASIPCLCPQPPNQGGTGGIVLGGAELAVRSIHPSPDEGRGGPSDAPSPRGNTTCFPSRGCWLAPWGPLLKTLSLQFPAHPVQGKIIPSSFHTPAKGPATSPPALKDGMLLSRQTPSSCPFILRISLQQAETLPQMSCCLDGRLDLPVRYARACGVQGRPPQNMPPWLMIILS